MSLPSNTSVTYTTISLWTRTVRSPQRLRQTRLTVSIFSKIFNQSAYKIPLATQKCKLFVRRENRDRDVLTILPAAMSNKYDPQIVLVLATASPTYDFQINVHVPSRGQHSVDCFSLCALQYIRVYKHKTVFSKFRFLYQFPRRRNV